MFLTFGIPTYNRAKSLERLLQILCPVLTGFKDIEVLVSDNCSTDNTEKIVEVYSRHFSFVRYTNNIRNLGFDGNILALYKKAKSEYIWFFSDDDVPVTENISSMILLLEKYRPSVAYANLLINRVQPFLKANDCVDITPYMPLGESVPIATDARLEPISELERMICVRLTSFISTTIVKRDPSLIEQLDDFQGSGIMQDAIMNMLLINRPSFVANARPCVVGTPKVYFSRWFMESGLWGIKQCYIHPKLKYSPSLSNKLVNQSILFILQLFIENKYSTVRVDFEFHIRDVFKLIKQVQLKSLRFYYLILKCLYIQMYGEKTYIQR